MPETTEIIETMQPLEDIHDKSNWFARFINKFKNETYMEAIRYNIQSYWIRFRMVFLSAHYWKTYFQRIGNAIIGRDFTDWKLVGYSIEYPLYDFLYKSTSALLEDLYEYKLEIDTSFWPNLDEQISAAERIQTLSKLLLDDAFDGDDFFVKADAARDELLTNLKEKLHLLGI